MSDKAVKQYLLRYAEPETRHLEQLPAKYPPPYRHVVVIPAYQENADFFQRALNDDWFSQGTLMILVINQPDHQANTTLQQELFTRIRAVSRVSWQLGNLTLLTPEEKSCGDILLVDRFTTPIPRKQGVGLARKIGADLTLALIARNHIKTEWICSTDADAMLPDDYFSVLKTLDPGWVAAGYNFVHVGGSPEVRQATKTYEQAMRYYVAGLQQAGSPYAFFTIGSTLAFKATAYAQIRGFPKRAAGEDFYLLNKLIKTGTVGRIAQTVIQLESRLSDRVPFGTGMSAARILQLTQQGKPFCYYHPQTFIELQQVLQHFERLWVARNDLTRWLEPLPEYSADLLLKAGLEKFVAAQNRQSTHKKQFDAQLTSWFDGLKTLQFIHGLRDAVYPDVPLSAQKSIESHDS